MLKEELYFLTMESEQYTYLKGFTSQLQLLAYTCRKKQLAYLRNQLNFRNPSTQHPRDDESHVKKQLEAALVDYKHVLDVVATRYTGDHVALITSQTLSIEQNYSEIVQALYKCALKLISMQVFLSLLLGDYI